MLTERYIYYFGVTLGDKVCAAELISCDTVCAADAILCSALEIPL